jgi:hypothetical protein
MLRSEFGGVRQRRGKDRATALDLEESESVRVFTRDRRRCVGFIIRDIFSFYHN